MDLRTLMALSPEDLAAQQHVELKAFVLSRLQSVLDLVKNEQYATVHNKLENSPAGDGYGDDNRYIDFSDSGVGEDIGDMIDKLSALKSLVKK